MSWCSGALKVSEFGSAVHAGVCGGVVHECACSVAIYSCVFAGTTLARQLFLAIIVLSGDCYE